jgi:mRNA-degrading endonuclease RelE of RelBE toxin-antitoxin system
MTSSAPARRKGVIMSPMATKIVDCTVAGGHDPSLKLIVSALAAKDLAALPGRDRRALFGKVEAFAADPFATHPAVRPMRGHEDRIRLRHGDWRAVCRIDRAAAAVTLERVAHRREIYR